MNRHVSSISARLSLRAPQRESLEILAQVLERVEFSKTLDVDAALKAIQAEFPSVTSFDRDFPSLCFALATGVGKTRLMGAFISYLYLEKNIRHFFVLAPNLTIYNKLKEDFRPNTPKYVFQGIAEFANAPPEIITGDDYEKRATLDLYGVHINIFNISKLNAEARSGKAPRIKRLSEYIGQSYFDYLASLDDLVLLMDESHRYRAKAGLTALNDLKPILGLELTATPQVESGRGKTVPFQNIIYSYPLHRALEDGFVKEPAVATRENFDPRRYSEDQLEILKLEDGIVIHENVKLELELYARENQQPLVKPFVLVVAQDTEHANRLMSFIQSDDFYGTRYKNRVITVHSNQRGEEKDETIERLVSVENPAEPTEIVIHVNMLKEGWDVTNLYTIIPLRAANSKTLVEQSIGRGLRLPYGIRTGVASLDRLTIVAHDRFQEIVDYANNPNSIIRTGIVIGRDIAPEPKQMVLVPPTLETLIGELPTNILTTSTTESNSIVPPTTEAPAFTTPTDQAVARTTLKVIEQQFRHLPTSAALRSPNIQAELVTAVKQAMTPTIQQGTLDGVLETANVPKVVAKLADLIVAKSIDVPRIIILPKGEVTSGFHDFDLEIDPNFRPQPVAQDILVQNLRDRKSDRLKGDIITKEPLPENYLVRRLIDHDDISYEDHADLLYKLSGQFVEYLRSYPLSEEKVHNVLQYHEGLIARLIYTQMQQHYWETATEYIFNDD